MLYRWLKPKNRQYMSENDAKLPLPAFQVYVILNMDNYSRSRLFEIKYSSQRQAILNHQRLGSGLGSTRSLTPLLEASCICQYPKWHLSIEPISSELWSPLCPPNHHQLNCNSGFQNGFEAEVKGLQTEDILFLNITFYKFIKRYVRLGLQLLNDILYEAVTSI